MKARINNQLMPIIFNGQAIVIALDPKVEGDDQRVVFDKRINQIVFTENAKLNRNKRRRIKLSPFINY